MTIEAVTNAKEADSNSLTPVNSVQTVTTATVVTHNNGIANTDTTVVTHTNNGDTSTVIKHDETMVRHHSKKAILHILVGGQLDCLAGDYVGRHKEAEMQQAIAASVGSADKKTLEICFLWAAIDLLRMRITVLRPAQEALIYLNGLQSSLTRDINFYTRKKKKFNQLNYSKTLVPDPATTNLSFPNEELKSRYATYHNDLEHTQAQFLANQTDANLLVCWNKFRQIQFEVNVEIATIKGTFLGAVNTATACQAIVQNLKVQIGHRDLLERAEIELEHIAAMLKTLDLAALQLAEYDPLSESAQAAVRTMIQIVERKSDVEALVHLDQRMRKNTSLLVTASVLLALVVAVCLTLFGPLNFTFDKDKSLKSIGPYFLGIPWPVLVWSLIGSFAAMIHRFNQMPIYEFSDLLKWLVTRPVQGMVLAAAFYYIVNTGLFAFTNGPTATVSDDYLILILCFLVGFSDRFADGIFNILVNRFSAPNLNPQSNASVPSVPVSKDNTTSIVNEVRVSADPKPTIKL